MRVNLLESAPCAAVHSVVELLQCHDVDHGLFAFFCQEPLPRFYCDLSVELACGGLVLICQVKYCGQAVQDDVLLLDLPHVDHVDVGIPATQLVLEPGDLYLDYFAQLTCAAAKRNHL